ncbi:MAG: hypothetical protein LBU81_06250 [Methanosarcinales archaeon]|jgi:hypothetical protein|nr:hypothetical protein [Methanosarcinales archaeon]
MNLQEPLQEPPYFLLHPHLSRRMHLLFYMAAVRFANVDTATLPPSVSAAALPPSGSTAAREPPQFKKE